MMNYHTNRELQRQQQTTKMTDILTWFLTALACYWLWTWIKSHKRLPPGPTRLPIIGSYLSLYTNYMSGSKPKFLDRVKLVKDFGNVVGLRIPGMEVVLVADYDKIKALCKKEESTGRMLYPLMAARPGYELLHAKKMPNAQGILFTHGSH